MHALTLIAEAIPEAEREPLPCAPIEGVCCITGESGLCVPRKDLLGKSFTDQHLLRAPESPLVSAAAWTALKYRPERASSWMCDGTTFRKLSRQDVRALVLDGVDAPRWAGYVTTSYKKHGGLRAPVNARGRQVWLFEMLLVDCSDRARVAEWWSVMTQAQRDGISRRSMEERAMPPGIQAKIGIDVWERFRAWARDKWESPMFALLTYLLLSAEEMKAEAPPPASTDTPVSAPATGRAPATATSATPKRTAGRKSANQTIPEEGQLCLFDR